MISLDYTIVYQMILFVVVWWILARVLFRPYLSLLEEREKRTAGAQQSAEALTHEGARLKAEYEEIIADARTRGTAAKEAIVEEGLRQSAELIGRSREEASRMLERVRQELGAQLEKERRLAAGEAAAIAQELVVKVLGRRVG
ncbi:MAG TPA: ATP synthase F0 subunit B [Candidatus Eisenbacteria bacterium]|nr:ATP synthase F0 subunit B [Candidatus Eisenbacteria bacterium]